MQGIIYLIRNKINGKCYIGQTINSIEQRLRDHQRGACKTSVIYKAIKKYGIESFEISTISNNVSDREELNRLEVLYIQEFDTLVPNGYNIASGGYGSNRQPIFTPEQVDEIIRLYLNGMSSTMLAKKYSVNHHTITKYLRRNGVEIRKSIVETQPQSIPEHLHAAISSEYLSGRSRKDISDMFGFSVISIDRLVRKLRITRRPNKVPLEITKEQFCELLDIHKQEKNVAAVLGITVSAVTYYKKKFGIPIKHKLT